MPHRDAVSALLKHAAACYGEDFPLSCDPARLSAVADAPPPRTPTADLAPTPDATAGGQPEAATPASPLEDLAAEVAPCTKCTLHTGRKNVVFGEGSPTARVMFVGEAPGQVEDNTGRPFVGRSGQQLDKIIEKAMGMHREDVFIANINKCRPPGNRDPEPDEIAACMPWLRAQIAIIQPEVIVTLGRVALWNLLGVSESMRRMRGREFDYEGTPVVPTRHPAYLLRTPSAKADTWEDIKRVNRMLGNPDVPPPV